MWAVAIDSMMWPVCMLVDLLIITVAFAKTDELISMLLGTWTYEGGSNCELDGAWTPG